MYEYASSVKSSISDEPINTYLLRPIAGFVVRVLYKTRITPNQVTVASTVAGIVAALVYLNGNPVYVACAGLLVTLKDVLDSADGQLARAKQQYSRRGRFLDSIGDFIVNVAVFTAIGGMLSAKHGNTGYGLLAFVGLVGITFRVSYHVFYQTSFLHLEENYGTNRVTEEILEGDRTHDRITLWLQRMFQVIYGWQDRLVLRLDRWCKRENVTEEFQMGWYSDTVALRFSGFLGMGTELFLLMVCSLFNKLELYLYLNATMMNTLLLLNVLYRRSFLQKRMPIAKSRSLR